MKKGRPFLLMLTIPMILSGLTSCAKKGVEHGEFVKDPELDYLYDVTYNNYNWDDATDWMNGPKHHSLNQGAFGCSSVHLGNFYGRSFDFCVTDMCEFLVRTNRENGHYASIGISIADCLTNRKKIEENDFDDKMIPFAMVDGINENGVVCNTNVAPAKDLPAHPGIEEEHYNTRGTNPGKKNLFYQFIPRFILDNAKSARHAVDLLKERNITAVNAKGEVCDMFGVSNMGYELHCMVADKDETYILEFINDQMSVVRGHIMTNYYLSETTRSGAGLERYQVLYEQKKFPNKERIEVDSIDKMKELIQYVQYSPCYNPEWYEEYTPEKDPMCAMWPTEFAGCEVIDKEGIGIEELTFYNAADWCHDYWNEGPEDMRPLKEQLRNVTLNIKKYLSGTKDRPTKPEGSVPWISTHAEAYDIENLTLNLVTQEQTIKDGEKAGQYDFKEYKLFEE